MRTSFLTLLTVASLAAQSYTYDAAGRLLRVAYPSGGGIVYTYDLSDNLTSVLPLNIAPAPAGLQLTRDGAAVRLQWQPVSGAQSYIIYRSGALDGQWREIGRVSAPAVSYVDPGAAPGIPYSYRIAALTAAGETAPSQEVTLSAAIDLDPRSARAVALPAAGARSVFTAGAAAETAAGYATVSIDSGDAPYGLAVFQLTQNGVIVGETGVPASPPTRGSRIFVEHRTGVSSNFGQFAGTVTVNTGIALVNPNEQAASFRLTLRDRAGQTIASGSGTMPAGRHTARLVTDFQEIAPDFRMPAGFAAAIGYATLDIVSDRPLSVLALRLTVNQRGDLLFSTTAVADTQVPIPSAPLLFAHLPEGGGFNSKLSLMNISPAEQTGRIRLLDDNGAAFQVRAVEGQTAAEFPYSIPAGGAFVFETDGSSTSVRAGWVVVEPGPGQTTPVGSGTFRFVQGGFVTTESGISPAEPTTRARVYVDLSDGHDTGVAIANPGAAPSSIRVRGFALDGSNAGGLAGGPISLSGFGHTAAEARRLVTGLPANFRGLLEMESSAPFLALTVRSLLNSRRDLLLTTFPVADQTRPAPAPVVFPHLADGGGFRTEFILISPGSPSESTLRLFDSTGQPLRSLPQ